MHHVQAQLSLAVQTALDSGAAEQWERGGSASACVNFIMH
jgi:hypothetical protein